MLYTVAVVLLIAWLLGIVGTYTIGAFVHVLLVIALVLFVFGLLGGRRSLVSSRSTRQRHRHAVSDKNGTRPSRASRPAGGASAPLDTAPT